MSLETLEMSLLDEAIKYDESRPKKAKLTYSSQEYDLVRAWVDSRISDQALSKVLVKGIPHSNRNYTLWKKLALIQKELFRNQ
jgi:hypothetical protein